MGLKRLISPVIGGLLLLSTLTGCAPIIVGTAVGLAIADHENRRNRCIQYYGNPDCYPYYSQHRGVFPMGVHR